MKTLLHPAREDISLPNLLYALGDPVRLRVVGRLAGLNEEVSCGEFFAGETLAKSTQSHQFKILREAGLIRMVPKGRRVLVSLRREDLEARFPGLLETILATHQRQS